MKKRIRPVVILSIFAFVVASAVYFTARMIKNENKKETDNKNDQQISLNIEDESIPVIKEMEETKETDTEDKILNNTEDEPITSVSNKVSFAVTGDNLIHSSIIKYANILAGGSGEESDFDNYGFDFKPIYENIENDIKSKDIAIINQSSLVGSNDSPSALSGYPKFNSPSKIGDDLVDLGFDVVNIANNHIMDMKESGLISSINYWNTKNIHLLGGYKSEDELSEIENKIIDKNGIKFGILSYTCSTNQIPYNSSRAQVPLIAEETNGEFILKTDILESQMNKLRPNCDFLIVLINWGNNSGYEVNDFQIKAAKEIASLGADMIIGNGPKVIQKMEYISVASKSTPTFCAYSLGNFLGTMQYMDNLFGGILNFDVEKNGEKCELKNILFVPTVIHYDNELSNIRIYKLLEYTEELFNKHGSNLIYGFGKYEWYYDTLKKYIDSLYLPKYCR